MGNNAVKPFLDRKSGVLVVHIIGVGVRTVDAYVRAWPIKHGRAQPLSLGGVPDGFATIIYRIDFLLGIAQGERFARREVEKTVGHDAMMVGIKSSDEGVVVGEGLRGIRRYEPRFHPLVGHHVHERRVVPFGIVPTVAVERNDHGVMLLSQSCRAKGKKQDDGNE